jgi:ArsR family transcriptional regulator
MRNAVSVVTNIDKMFRAFSDRTRLRILYLLQSGECCVGNLVEILGIEQPNASRHLAYLRRAGLVSARKSRNWIYYSLAPATAPFHQKLLECLASCFTEVPQLRTDQTRAAKIRAGGGCCPGEEEPPTRPLTRQQKTGKRGNCCST